MDGDVVLLACEFQLYGRVRILRQDSRHQIEVVRLVLVAEPAAHELTHDAHVLRRDLEILGEIALAVRDALRRRVDGELVAAPFGDAHATLELRVVQVDGRVAVLEDAIRRAESVVGIATTVAFGLALATRVR